ncbi:hypothetical protein Gohar_003915 [Gossypium harknessii]|uniref:Reverse transcriptase zinc-binding domain-containing protein n=1 Tax=Gossypium harknessii TaxID=34285 RepID=A0A7J9H3A9_9ROSI|nr:hypothetical protein [Gossypium harknessii]
MTTMNHNLIFSDDPNYHHNTTSHPTTTNDDDSVSTLVLTNVEQVKQGIGYDSSCDWYGYRSEDILHVIINCPSTKEVWRQGIPWSANEIVKLSFSWAKQYTTSYRRIPPKQQLPRPVVLENWFSLCFDGAIQEGSGNATGRRVLLNGKGKWIMGYIRLLDFLEAVKDIQVYSFDASNYALIRRVHQLLANIGV